MSDYAARGDGGALLYLAAGLLGAFLDGLARGLARRWRRRERGRRPVVSTTPGRGDALGAALAGLVVFLGAYVALVLVEQLLGLDLWLLAFSAALVLAVAAATRQLRSAQRR